MEATFDTMIFSSISSSQLKQLSCQIEHKYNKQISSTQQLIKQTMKVQQSLDQQCSTVDALEY